MSCKYPIYACANYSAWACVWGFTCEKELLCAAAAPPPWCAPPSKPDEAVSGRARHLHSASESLWLSPIIGDTYWFARTWKDTEGLKRWPKRCSPCFRPHSDLVSSFVSIWIWASIHQVLQQHRGTECCRALITYGAPSRENSNTEMTH